MEAITISEVWSVEVQTVANVKVVYRYIHTRTWENNAKLDKTSRVLSQDSNWIPVYTGIYIQGLGENNAKLDRLVEPLARFKQDTGIYIQGPGKTMQNLTRLVEPLAKIQTDTGIYIQGPMQNLTDWLRP
jgi:hypothetical protein